MILFKKPFEQQILTVLPENEGAAVAFVSFDEQSTLKFSGNITPVSREDLPKITSQHLPSVSNKNYETADEYIEKIAEVIAFVKENNLPKLVISRRKEIFFDELNLTTSFLNITEKYPNAFCYLFVNEQECWMGAFSELLGKYHKKDGTFETMSLAGTLSVNENWGKKELEEQKPVTDYVRRTLKNFSTEEMFESETYDHLSGAIKHLRTDFKIRINPEDLDKLISELHPTPAVCGIPKGICKAAIADFERFPREFYAGYSRVEDEEFIQYFVNLRCGKFYQNAAELFVGGGITKDSEPQKEWHETELKAAAIHQNLIF